MKPKSLHELVVIPTDIVSLFTLSKDNILIYLLDITILLPTHSNSISK